jgi:hypothetical protein
MSPISDDTMKTIDRRAYRLIQIRAAVYLLRSAAQQQSRNNIQYSDQGFSVSESDKARDYQALAAELNQEFEMKAKNLKVSLNQESFWGGQHGEFYEAIYNAPDGTDDDHLL